MSRKLNFLILFVLASALCLTWSTSGKAKLPQAVGFWRFEGNSFDSGRGGNNGILKGTAALVTDAQRGKCLELDGNGYVEIPSGVAELGDADFTIVAWIKTTEIGVPILSKSNGNTEWQEMEKEIYIADSESSEADKDGTVEMVGHSVDWIRGSTPADDGKWHHIAVTWDKDADEGLVYVDGVEGTDAVGFAGLLDNPGDTVRIGFSESAHSSGNFIGRLDDVAIFDVTLTPEQVLELCELAGGVGTKATKATAADKDKPITLDTDPNLVGWWKFDETSGKTAADSSRHGRKGTLKGGLSFDNNSAEGRIGRALKLNGDDYVEITKYKGVTGTRPRSVSTWIKTKSSRGEITSWGADDYGKMWIYGFIRGRIGITPSGGYLYINAETHDDKWHHVAVMVRQAELPNLHDDVKHYLDGEPAEIHDIGLLDLWPIDTGKEIDVRIGRRFNGLLDDVRIYDRALSDEEVKALFRLRSGRPLPKKK